MKKKRLLIITALVLMILIVPFASMVSGGTGESYEDGTFAYKLYDEKENGQEAGAKIVRYLGRSAENLEDGHSHVIEIPETVTKDGKEYPVTAIGDGVFENNRSITKVVMPDSITSIGENVFNCCTNLKEVQISAGLTELGENAFFSCTRLVTVQTMEESENGEKALSPANQITLPKTLTKLGAGAFYDCQNITVATMLGDLSEVGDYVFGYCLALEEVVFEGVPSKISNQMFQNCNALQIVNMPDGMNSIGNRAFEGASMLVWFGNEEGSLVIPSTVESVGEGAFSACSGITSVKIPNCTLGEGAFEYCSNLATAEFTEQDEDPNNDPAVADISPRAFDSTEITALLLPKYVDNIANGAFQNANLNAIFVHEDNPHFNSLNGVLYNKEGTELVAYPVQNPSEAYTVENTVEKIRGYAFAGAANLAQVTLPESLKSIGEYAFYGIYNVTELTIPNQVREIEEGAFNYCGALERITLPEGLTYLADYLLDGCSYLVDVKIPDSVTTIGNNAFSFCEMLETVEIPANVIEISPSAFKNCTELSKVVVSPDNNSFVEENGILFNKDKSKLICVLPYYLDSTYTIPAETKAIGDYAFTINSNIRDVVVHKDVTEFGKGSIGFASDYFSDSLDRSYNFCLILPEGNETAVKYADDNDIAYFAGVPVVAAEEITLEAGETFDFAIGNAIEDTILYTSTDEFIASVDRRGGMITGVSEGSTYVVASIGSLNYVCNVTVTSGERPVVEGTEYRDISAILRDWEMEYRDNNPGISFDALDNSNLIRYTSNDYIAILAKTQGGKYIAQCDEVFGVGGYEQFGTIAKNLSLEMERYNLHENLVLYRGTGDLSQYTTNKTSKLNDMYDSIGAVVKTGNKEGETRYQADWVASTSVDHMVSFYFGSGSTRSVLEIYAPANYTKGAYINDFSNFDNESELLLEGGTEFKVIDAGVRVIEMPGINTETITDMERYMKLQIVGAKGEESKDFGTPVVIVEEKEEAPIPEMDYEMVVYEEIEVTPEFIEVGLESEQMIKNALYDRLQRILGNKFNKDNSVIWDIKVMDGEEQIYNFPEGGGIVTIPYPEEAAKNWEDYDFTILHMFGYYDVMRTPGEIEGPMYYEKTEEGLKIIMTSASPFAIHWAPAEENQETPVEPDEDVNGGETDKPEDQEQEVPTEDEKDPASTEKEEGKDKETGGSNTGDDSRVMQYAILFTVSALLAGTLFFVRKKLF